MWSTASGGGTTGTWQTKSGGSGIATFAAGTNATGSYTITVSGTITGIRGLTFQDTISGNTLTLSGGTLTLAASSAINVTNSGAKGLISSVLTDGASTFGITKTGAGTLSLTGANTYGGATTLSAGILEANTLGDGGVASSIGNSSNGAASLVFNGGTLRYVGTGASTNRQFTLNSTGGTIDSSGTGALVFTNQGGLSGSGNRTLTLSGSNTGNNTFGLLLQNSAGTTSLTKSGNGTWLMTNQNNSFTGPTTISGGVLSVGSLNNIGSTSSIGSGNSSTAATNAASLVLNGGTLRYTGGAVSTNRLFTLGTAGGTIDASGSGALTFSNTGAVVASGSGNRTLTLTGSNTGNNTLASIIANPTTGTTSLQKTGSGTWVLTGANTYTGTTSIGTANGATGGTLVLGNNNVLPGSAVNVYAGTLNYNSRTDTIGALNLGGGASGTSATVAGTSGTLTLGGNVTYSADNNNNGATISGNLGLGGSIRTFNIGNSTAAANDLSISANITGVGGGILKTGTGTLALSGASNTFSGGITVNDGVLLGTGTTNIGGFAAFGDYSSVVVPTTVITVNNGGTLAVNSSYVGGDGSFATTQLLNIELNGTGYDNLGALRATGGTNTWNGNVSLGSNATITNAAANGDANILYLGPWNGAAPTFLTLNNHTVTFNGTGDVYVNSAIGASTGDTGKVVIDAAASNAIVYFGGPRNYFTGDTEIKNGILEGQVNPGNYPNTAILGNLVIGDGTGGTGSAVMRQYFNHQIADTSTVTINSDGKLDLSLYGGKTEVIQKLVLNGGQVDSTNGLLVLAGVASGNDVEVTANSTFAGNFDLNNVGGGTLARTINVSQGATFTLNANLFGKDFIKNGDGTMVMGANNNANGYTGRTRIEGGVLRLTNSGALGGTGGGSEAAGTSVSSGATLQLSGGTLAVPAEGLILNGAGYNSLGALNNASGNNSWAGAIKLNSDSTIKTDAGSLLITGSITGTAGSSATQTLTVGGVANTTISGPIYDGSGGGKLDVTKVDSGTLTLNGLNSFTGAINVNAGTVAVTAHNVLGAQTNAVAVSSGATFKIDGSGTTISNTIGRLTGSGLVSIVAATDTLKVNNTTANTFDGRLSGSGLFEKSGAGTFTFSSTSNTNAFNFAGTVKLTEGMLEFQGGGNLASTALSIGTLHVTGGTLLLTDAFINVGTLNITGDTILDFGTTGSSILNATNIYIAAGKTLLIKNWTSEVDYLFATGTFRQNNSSGTIAVWNAIGANPESQVHFEGDPWSPDGSHTTWTNYDYDGYANLQIRPIPEPSTYGLCFLASCAAFIGWRRYRRNRR